MEIKVEKVSRFKVLAFMAMIFSVALFAAYNILSAIAEAAPVLAGTVQAARMYAVGDVRIAIDAAYILLVNMPHPTLYDWRVYLGGLIIANMMASMLPKGNE